MHRSELHNAAEDGDVALLTKLLSGHSPVDEDFDPVRCARAPCVEPAGASAPR